MTARVLVLVALAAGAEPVFAAPSGSERAQFQNVLKRAAQVDQVVITEAEELQIGEAVSERVRMRYGVVQDVAVHRYVALVGMALAQSTSRPNLPWRFIVLDTDGVNAFAAPGGYIHVTRGALGLIASEAELATVLGHEMTHVTEKHTVGAIRKLKAVEIGAGEVQAADSDLFKRLVDGTTEIVLAGFGRAEELESDREALRLVNRVGYRPAALTDFLKRLSERNADSTQKQGLFASHPEMKERLERIDRQIRSEKLVATAVLDDRYRSVITYRPTPLAEIATVEPLTAAMAGGGKSKDAEAPKKEESKPKGGFGLARLLKPGGEEKKSAEVTGSGASRGVDTERNARGGLSPTPVVVTVTQADIAAFKKDGNLR